MNLDEKIWSTAQGGYRISYNAAKPLRRLKEASQPEELEQIFDELLENLHHNGTIGLASYLAVPQLISICMEKKSLDPRYLQICVLVEHCRLRNDNPAIPGEYEHYYFDALTQFEKYLLINFKSITDRTSLRLTLALFATLNGQPELGQAIEQLKLTN